MDADHTSCPFPSSQLPEITGGSEARNCASSGTVYGMNKTTVYLPEALKQAVERLERQRACSEAEVIRQAVQDAISRPEPRPRIIPCDSAWAENVDDHMAGFGE